MPFERYLRESPIFQVYRANQQITQSLNPKLLEIGVNFVQSFILLTVLFDKQKRIGPTSLSEMLGISKGTISHHLSALEDKKLVFRKLGLDDGRSITLNLTKEGKLIANQVIKLLNQFDSLIEKNLDEQSLNGLTNGLYSISMLVSSM